MNDERSAGRVDRHAGRKVRQRRLEVGMSQERLAELLGVTFQQVQKYERGVNRIAVSRLFDIAQALEVAPGWFFPDTAAGDAPIDLEAVLDSADGVKLAELFARATKRKRAAILRAAEVIVE